MTTRNQHSFEVTVERGSGGRSQLLAQGLPEVVGGAPPEFGGQPGIWSPEHLLLAATALCFITTFDWFLARAKGSVERLACQATGQVDKTAKGLAFTSIQLHVTCHVPADQRPAVAQLIERAHQSCLISHSLACPVALSAAISEDAVAA